MEITLEQDMSFDSHGPSVRALRSPMKETGPPVGFTLLHLCEDKGQI